jgi:hypothetical protein
MTNSRVVAHLGSGGGGWIKSTNECPHSYTVADVRRFAISTVLLPEGPFVFVRIFELTLG